eukprot:scaffold2675_cov398-Prasinococcus_capsulatus_cf.AAC.1
MRSLSTAADVASRCGEQPDLGDRRVANPEAGLGIWKGPVLSRWRGSHRLEWSLPTCAGGGGGVGPSRRRQGRLRSVQRDGGADRDACGEEGGGVGACPGVGAANDLSPVRPSSGLATAADVALLPLGRFLVPQPACAGSAESEALRAPIWAQKSTPGLVGPRRRSIPRLGPRAPCSAPSLRGTLPILH